MFNYYKLLRRYNTLKLKYNQLENLVKTNCFNQLLKKLGEPYEIERKFLIEYPNIQKLEKMKNCEKVEIIQTYLKSENGEETRIRQRGKNGNYIYSKTTKKNVSSIKRIVFSVFFHLKQLPMSSHFA